MKSEYVTFSLKLPFLDVPSICLSARAICIIKSEYGLPVGIRASKRHNNVEKNRKEMGTYTYSMCPAGSCLITQSLGADFVSYGLTENSEAVFPAYAMANAIIAYNARRFGIRPETRHHPLFGIF